MLFFKSSKRQLNIYIFIAIQDQAIMHIFEMIWYPPLASLTKILQANVIQKKEARHSHVQNGWWHILCSHFFSLKRYFDDAIHSLKSSYLWLVPLSCSTIKICPFRIMPPTLAKAERPSGKFPGYFTSLCANSKCEMAVMRTSCYYLKDYLTYF